MIRTTLFAFFACAGVAVAFCGPNAQASLDVPERLRQTGAVNGYELVGHETGNSALSIFSFSSKTCQNIKIMPVSVVLQEKAMLERVGLAGDRRELVYLHDRWSVARFSSAAWPHLYQRMLQMVRARPLAEIQSMLYIITPQQCGQMRQADWSGFWNA